MRNIVSIKSAQIFLWSLTIVALWFVLKQNDHEVQTFEVFSITLAQIKIAAGLRLDILSSLLFFMITTLGAGIGQYSLRYLDGEIRQGYFYKHLVGIIVSASLLVLSSNLLMFFVMWLSISYNLHKLLVFFADRLPALIAARKKAIVSRLGDVALLAAILLTYSVFGSFDFSDIFVKARTILPYSDSQNSISAIGLLIAIGALAKSAQFPFHFWLPETMETPTPVSALMHAGVINAGGFLVIRMSPVLEHATAAHVLLAIVGTISAVFGALCMIVQNDIKKKLAYSTISQMGMMMFACGLGAYSLALFHIFAHSFYKAYAFLSTGRLVDESKKIGLTIKAPATSTIVVGGMTGFVSIAVAAQYNQGAYLPSVTYGAILLLGFLQSLSVDQKSHFAAFGTLSKIVAAMLLAIVFYSGIEYTLNQYVKQFVPSVFSSPFDRYTLTVISLIGFSIYFGSFVLSTRLMNIDTPFLERAYIYLKNGGYWGAKSSVLLARIKALPEVVK